ncbi:hypothetical protein HDV01_001485 [Terramyces sp. JEL0728]|nr:hypothetical protein HDV01_001485 [Terramyces sp. JEL0728]
MPKNHHVRSAFRINFSITHTISWVVFMLYWGAIYPTVVSLQHSPMAHILTSIIGHIVNLAFPVMDLYLEYNRMTFAQVLLPLSIFVWYEVKLVYQVVVNKQQLPYEWLQQNLTFNGNFDWLYVVPFLLFLNGSIIAFHCITIHLSKKFHHGLQDSLEARKLLKN